MSAINLDPNNLQDRIDTLYFATDKFIKREPVAKISITQEEVKEGTFKVSFEAGEISKHEVRSAKHTFTDMISRLANLKDPLKNKFKNAQLNDKIVEDYINNSEHLQIIMDLNNAEKHGYPLQKTRRSKLDPRIENIQKVMALPLQSGKFTNLFSDSVVIFIADIVDLNGKKTHDFHDLIEKAISDWEKFCIKYFPSESPETIRRQNAAKRHSEWKIDHFDRGQQVQELIQEKGNWVNIDGSQVIPHMFIRAINTGGNKSKIMGYPSRPYNEWTSKQYIPLTNVETGEQLRLSKIKYSWEVLMVDKQEDLKLVSNYYWELLNPPNFE